MNKKNEIEAAKSESILYLTEHVRTINEHIKNIFAEGELVPEAVVRNFQITAADGKNYNTAHYNLDVIISGISVLRRRYFGVRVENRQQTNSQWVKICTIRMI